MNYQQAYDCEWAVPKEVQNVYLPELKPKKAKCRGLRCESNLESDRRDLGQNIYGSVFKRARTLRYAFRKFGLGRLFTE